MSCEIIQFSAAARPVRPVIDNRVLTPMQRRREGKPELLPPATETAKNARIRTERRDAWWLAERAEKYWYARWKWFNALEIARKYKIGDSGSFPPPAHAISFEAVGKWREAVAKQLRSSCLRRRLHLPTSRGSAPRSNRMISSNCRSRWRARNGLSLKVWRFLAAHPTLGVNRAQEGGWYCAGG